MHVIAFIMTFLELQVTIPGQNIVYVINVITLYAFSVEK